MPKPLWRRQWQPTPVLLPGKSHGWWSLVVCSPWGGDKSGMTEQLHFHFHALEKEMATHFSVLTWRIPRTTEPGGLVYGIAQSWTRPKWLSSSSSSSKAFDCVDHNKQWKILKEMGIPDHVTCLLRNLYTGQEATVRTGHGTTDWFQIGKNRMSRLYIVTLLI